MGGTSLSVVAEGSGATAVAVVTGMHAAVVSASAIRLAMRPVLLFTVRQAA
jgi:hypothetical protein